MVIFCLSGGVSHQRGPVICHSGGFIIRSGPILPIRKGSRTGSANREGSKKIIFLLTQTMTKHLVNSFRILGKIGRPKKTGNQ